LLDGAPGADWTGVAGERRSAGASLGRQVEIQFTAAEYHRREGMRFEYRLLGLDSRWYDARQQRSVSYALAHPGDYTFEVRAFNAHGYAGTIPARVALTLEPRWLERTTVRIGAALLGAGLIALVAVWRVREMRRIHRLEYASGLERERARLAADLHDGLGSRLTEINLLSGQLAGPTGGAAGGPAPSARPGDDLRERSAEAIESLRELIWATNPQADTLESLVARLCDQVEQAARAAGLRCRFDVPDDVPAVTLGPGLRRDVLLAVREVVNNAIRHAHADELMLRIALGQAQWTIEVRDDGQGFDPAQAIACAAKHDRGLGLRSIQERIRGLGGTCRIETQPGAGTAVILEVPRTRE
jgi:signal transduction histidine kinase